MSQRDRLLMGSVLQRNLPALLILGVLALALVIAVANLLGIIGSFEPDAVGVFFQALLLSALLSLMPLAILWYLDRRERESPIAVMTAILWGGLIATGLSAPLNTLIIQSLGNWISTTPAIQDRLGAEAAFLIGAPLAGPIVEETLKGLGILALLLLLRAEFDNMRDGFIYGALVGLGFTCLESALHLAQNYAAFGFAPWGLQLGGRYSLFGMSGHVLFSGILGLFLGLALQTSRTWVRIAAPLLGWLLAMAAHAFYNVLPLVLTLVLGNEGDRSEIGPPPNPSFIEAFVQRSVMDLIVFLPFLVLLLLLLWRSGVWERNIIRAELRDEVGPWVTPEEYERIQRDGIFQSRRISNTHRRLSEALVNAQNELAFRKYHVRQRGENPDHDALVESWREEIASLRAELGTSV